ERERQQHADYEWCLRDPEVQRRYGSLVVAAQGFKVWGAGANHNEAWEAARAAGCPDLEALALVAVPGPWPGAASPRASWSDTRCQFRRGVKAALPPLAAARKGCVLNLDGDRFWKC